MRASSPCLRGFIALISVFVLVGAVAAAPVGEEAAQREKLLKLNEITGKLPTDGQIREFTDKPEETKKLLVLAVKMVGEKEQPFNVNATYILAKSAQRIKEYEAAEKFYKLHSAQGLKLGSTTKVGEALTGLIDVFYIQQKYGDAEKVCKEFLELRGDETMERLKGLVMRRLVLMQAKQGKTDEAIKVCDTLIKAQPENWLMLELKADVLRTAGKYEEAVEIYNDVIARVVKDKRLEQEIRDDFADDVRYTLSGVYIEMKQVEKAADQLKTLLKKKPDNPTYNNDLGFIWADHDMNLEESENLIRKALEEDKKIRKKTNPELKDDKDNPSYLDSLGWVLYKRKKYKEALSPLQEAVAQEEGQHLEIYDHLGDVYIGLDKKKEAVEAWKKGLTCKLAGKRDEDRKIEVEKKIKKYSAEIKDEK